MSLNQLIIVSRLISILFLIFMSLCSVAFAQDQNQLRLARANNLIREGQAMINRGNVRAGKAKVALGEKMLEEAQAQIEYERKNSLEGTPKIYKLEVTRDLWTIFLLQNARDMLQNLHARSYKSILFNQVYMDVGRGWEVNHAATELVLNSLLEADADSFTVSAVSDLNVLIEDGEMFLSSPDDLSLSSRPNTAIIYAELIHEPGDDEFLYSIRAIDTQTRYIIYSELRVCSLDEYTAGKLLLQMPDPDFDTPLYNTMVMRDVHRFIDKVTESNVRYTFATSVTGEPVFPFNRTLPLYIKHMVMNNTLLPISDSHFLTEVLRQPDGNRAVDALPEKALWMVRLMSDAGYHFTGARLLCVNTSNSAEVDVGPLELSASQM